MIQYWPFYQSLELNKQVVSLFYNTRQKLSYNLSNNTNYKLYIDLLDYNNKRKLFSNVLIELEVVILDIIALDLTITSIKLLSSKILFDLIYKSLKRFIPKLQYNYNDFFSSSSIYLRTVFNQYHLLIEHLLIYLTHGSSEMQGHFFVFDYEKTPTSYVYVLFENLLVQVSDLIIYCILSQMNSLFSIINFIKNNNLSNISYFSIRSISLFLNTLLIQNIIQFYFGQPKSIYDSRYKVWLLSSSGLVVKSIYVSRWNDIYLLSKFQLFVFFLVEIQDLIVPQVEKCFFIISKIFLYLLVSFFGNTVIFCIRFILSNIYNNYK
uniref:hypothetical protein n=1 Tax=Hypnea brasiliensis TaxID=1866962 RepID=UPI0023F362DB|nr:hypothetical protein P8481_pgp100 [Hypnea brasiliensis]WCH55249.1 hypothetical protein [Hypnea brasiliensis]WDY84772.1 hypothetical protein [Hypnea brasiliensis]